MADYSWLAPILQVAATEGIKLFKGDGSLDQKALAELMSAKADVSGVGDLNIPEIQAAQVGDSVAGNTTANQDYVNAQKAVLDKLLRLEQNGGMLLEDKAAAEDFYDEAARRDSNARSSIQEQMARQGTLGSGAQLAMNLDAAQSTSGNRYKQARDTAAMAQKRALDAMLKRSGIAGEMNSRDFDQRFHAGGAQDAIRTYNADKIMEARRLNQARYQPMAQFKLDKAKAAAGQSTNIANQLNGQQQKSDATSAGYGAAAGDAFKTWNEQQLKDEEKKRVKDALDEEERIRNSSVVPSNKLYEF